MKSFSFEVFNVCKSLLRLVVIICLSVGVASAQAQASTADLTGTVVDQNDAAIPNATVIVVNSSTGISRTVTTNETGEYQVIGLQPGAYEVSASANSFKTLKISNVKLTVGQRAELTIKLEVGGGADVVVDIDASDVKLVETTSTVVSNTIEQERIQNLPINERSAIGFLLTISTVGRDNGRPIGPAPTSGLNIGGQRGRSTLVQVDGSDFTDNSINASRSTVSQEAVQEYQVAINSYAPEFGRAIGGIVNVVTKRGTNEYRGNVFGFIRDKTIQARNSFSPVAKPDFRRTQWGGTFGGPIRPDKTFFFASYERRDRDESGFFTSNPAEGLNNSITVGAPVLPFTQTFSGLTRAQATWANRLLASRNPALITAAVQYLNLATSGTSTALTGSNPLRNLNATNNIPIGQQIGSRFFLSGAPVPFSTIGTNNQPIAFRPLNNLRKVFPVTENTNFLSIRVDHNFNDDHQLMARFSYNTNDLTGMQVESQNQSLGQNDFSRTGIQDITDYSFTTGLNSVLGTNWANEFRFTWAKRNAKFRPQNGEAVAFNITGTAFIGRELFSPVDRSETRFQFADNVNWVLGNHTFKFGGDVNFITIPDSTFELNFAGLFNFGQFNAGNLNRAFAQLNAPAFTPVQSYGLGLPSIYIQGFGNPESSLKNNPLAFFAQDTWQVLPNLTINYGVRYDIELTSQIAPVAFSDPLSGISLSASDILSAQNAVNVQQGFPRDKNNWAPRFGFSYDPFKDGKTIIRGAIGLFYDHPLLAIASNSDIADAVQQQQSFLTPGLPAFLDANGNRVLLNAAQVFHGTVCGLNGSTTRSSLCPAGSRTPGAASSANYQFGRQRFNDQTFPGFGAVLPFTLPVSKDFKYAYATQANFTIERQLTKNMSLSASYVFVGARHLPHPTDSNTPNTALQIQNFRRFAGRNPISTIEAVNLSIPSVPTSSTQFFACPGAPTLTCFNNPTVGPNQGRPFVLIIPGMITAPLTNPSNRIVAPAIANFFRPNAPNYFLARALSGGQVTKAVLDTQLAGSLRTPGTISPFGSVVAQVSDSNSSYNALNIELKHRLANNFQFLASYTWSHSIDDSSDLQSLLIAQDVNNLRAERSDSLFDQRHRFVFSGVMVSPAEWRDSDTMWKGIFADFMVAPIIEFSSGRPFNIITNSDTNNDQSTQTDRPNVDVNGNLTLPPPFSTGNLGRNRGITRAFASVDLRVSRSFYFGERFKLELIGEVFNLFNRFNEAAASPFFDDVNAFGKRDSKGRFFSVPTAAFDPRQFQFGAKLTF